MNEEDMRKKMVKRKEELEDQRKKFIDDSFNIQNKCKDFQKQLKGVQNLTNDLQEELKFLDEQLVYSDQNNSKQKQELEALKQQILFYDPNYSFLSEEQIWQLDTHSSQPQQGLNAKGPMVSKSANYYVGKYNTNGSVRQLSKHYESPYSKHTFQKQ